MTPKSIYYAIFLHDILILEIMYDIISIANGRILCDYGVLA